MKISLREITEEETHLEFTENDSWVVEAIQRVDEDSSSALNPGSNSRPVQAIFNLRKVDGVVVINGEVDTHVRLLCSRCANSFRFPCDRRFSALFCKDPVMAGVGFLQEGGREQGKPSGKNRGYARHAHDDSADANDSSFDLDITYLSNDDIDLGEVLSEQVRLLIPFQPLCQAECKGMCAHCGADMNVGRCACSKLKSSSPFAVLRDLKT